MTDHVAQIAPFMDARHPRSGIAPRTRHVDILVGCRTPTRRDVEIHHAWSIRTPAEVLHSLFPLFQLHFYYIFNSFLKLIIYILKHL